MTKKIKEAFCITCAAIKSMDQFYKNRTHKGKQYFDVYCIPCRQARSRKYYQEHQEKLKKQCNDWYHANREKMIAYMAAKKLVNRKLSIASRKK